MTSRKKKNEKRALLGARKVIGYIRVSTAQQASAGGSIEAQQEAIESYCRAFGYELVTIETDAGVSASTTDRPALKSALERLERGEAGSLLVAKLDRLSRRLRDMVSLVDEYFRDRFALMSVSESIDTATLTGRLVLNVLTAVAEWEREAAVERTQAVMAHMRASGKFTGGHPPCGYVLDEDGALVEDPYEQQVMQAARALRAQGVALRNIAAKVPVNPRTGKMYSASQIGRMVAQ